MRCLSRFLASLALALGASATEARAQRAILISPPGEGDCPEISADGRTVVYTSDFSDLRIVRPDGSGLRTYPLSSYTRRALSADGRLVVFDSWAGSSGGYPHVWLMDLSDASVRKLSAQAPFGGWLPAISDDGSTVTFYGFTNGLYAVDADGTNLRLLFSSGEVGAGGPSVTADGSVAVFEVWGTSFESQIFRVNSDGSGLARLTMDPNRFDFRPRISADGTKVTFEHVYNDLYLAHGDGSGIDQLTSGKNIHPLTEERNASDLSADGSVAAFKSYDSVFVIRTDGTGLRQVGYSPGYMAGPSLSGRGDVVVFKGMLDGVPGIIAAGVPGKIPGEMDDLAFSEDARTLTWATSPAANSHNLYRGDLEDLRSGGFGGCLQSGIIPASATDDAVPPIGKGYVYLAAGANGAGEGALGFTGAGDPRLPTVACPPVDTDGDGTPDAQDMCPLTSDPGQQDADGDGVGDACDNCAVAPNADQTDGDGDGLGGRCECLVTYNPGAPDTDGDVLADTCDNCPATYNPDQAYSIDPVVQVLSPNGGGGTTLQIGSHETLTWSATDVCGGVGLVDLYLSRTGPAGPYEPIALGLSNLGSFTWQVTGPATSAFTAYLRVRARDPGGNSSQDESDNGFRIRP